MRVFKHGDALAIVFPQSIAGASGIKEGEELEFVEIEKGLFVLARKEKLAEALKPRVEQAFASSAAAQPRQPEQSGLAAFFKRELDSKGFVVVFAEKGAQEVSVALEKEFKSGAIRGTRGFDSKFYLAKRTFVEESSPKLLKQLQSPSSVEQLAEKTRLPEDAVKALLCILMEEGEVIEKKKGLFTCA
ncbi:hypothetical protein J4220_02845 [Candidatus Micrarchaeota archaeon]|nr:hypothetical protein [Candidatus Micrarchaeota archaeon]